MYVDSSKYKVEGDIYTRLQKQAQESLKNKKQPINTECTFQPFKAMSYLQTTYGDK